MKNRFFLLDTVEVDRLIESQELKRYWVAEVAGVHKTTLQRWLSGKIARVREDRLVNLARVFEIQPSHIAQNYSGQLPS